ncbi:hypothetical protein [Streptomyces goshikiensis]|uniref:hypothetical protein n=1 Tax=Streptomyces goshikiensis TaxID=1942 RepID=UPI00367AFC85
MSDKTTTTGPATLRERAASLEGRVPPAAAGPRTDDERMLLEKAAALRAQADLLEQQANIAAAAGTEVLREQIDRAVAFLAARLAEYEVDPTFHRALGRAVGYAEACLDHHQLEGAARQLLWLHAEARAWRKHSDYFKAIR